MRKSIAYLDSFGTTSTSSRPDPPSSSQLPSGTLASIGVDAVMQFVSFISGILLCVRHHFHRHAKTIVERCKIGGNNIDGANELDAVEDVELGATQVPMLEMDLTRNIIIEIETREARLELEGNSNIIS